jgi:hypothetical protein
MALDNLQFLTQLDLSDNNLKGEVPTNGVLKNSTAIPLNGNCDLCGGLPDLHMPPCYTDFPEKTNTIPLGQSIDPSIWHHINFIVVPLFTHREEDFKWKIFIAALFWQTFI